MVYSENKPNSLDQCVCKICDEYHDFYVSNTVWSIPGRLYKVEMTHKNTESGAMFPSLYYYAGKDKWESPFGGWGDNSISVGFEFTAPDYIITIEGKPAWVIGEKHKITKISTDECKRISGEKIQTGVVKNIS